MNREEILKEFEEEPRAWHTDTSTQWLSEKIDQLQAEHEKELKEQAERADDHFASVLAGVIEDIRKMKRKTDLEDDDRLWAANDEGYNEAINDIISHLLKCQKE